MEDLRAINEIVLPRFPLVPNPSAVMTSIPATSTHYTVLALCSAFFSIPLHKDSQNLFAFTYDDQQYVTRLPQGYTESPTIFSQILHSDLKDLSFPGGSTLIQYVDDLLLASPSATTCETDSCPSPGTGREGTQNIAKESPVVSACSPIFGTHVIWLYQSSYSL